MEVHWVVGDDVLLAQVHFKHKPFCAEPKREIETGVHNKAR